MIEPTSFPIELTQQEYGEILFLLGYLAAVAGERDDQSMQNRTLRLANAISRHNPNWESYEVESEKVPA